MLDTSLLIAVLLAMIVQSGTMWYKIGQLERGLKKSCPFGSCPLYKRATDEAAPERTEKE